MSTLNVQVRTTPHQADAEEIQSANRSWKEQGQRTRVPSTSKAAIEAARSAREAGLAELRGWLFHPDERVVFALLENPHRPWEGPHAWYLRAGLLARAERINQSEGLCWNPILDRLETSDLCATSQDVERWNQKERQKIEARDGRQAQVECAEQIREALAAEGGEQLLDQALPAQSSQLLRTFEDAIAVSDEAVVHLNQSPRAAAHLLRNPHLRPEQAQRIFSWVLERLTTGRTTQWAHAERLAFDAYEARYGVQEQVVEELLQTMAEAFLAKDEGIAGPIRRTLAYRVAGSENAMERLYACLGEERDVLYRLIAHPSTSLALLRTMSRERSDFQMRRRIAEREGALQDPELADLLSASQSTEIRQIFLRKGHGRHFREALRQALDSDPRMGDLTPAQAAAIVHRRFDEVWSYLELEEVKQLDEALKSPNFQIRANPHSHRGEDLQPLLPRYRAHRLEGLLTSHPAEFAPALLKVAEELPDVALEALAQAGATHRDALTREDLHRLCQAPDQRIRLATIQMMGQLAEEDARELEEPAASAPSRRR